MKKVKIMLTAITVFAVVGGALAFKTAKFQTTLFCATESSETCPIQTHATIEPNAVDLGPSFCTDKADGSCLQPIETYAND